MEPATREWFCVECGRNSTSPYVGGRTLGIEPTRLPGPPRREPLKAGRTLRHNQFRKHRNHYSPKHSSGHSSEKSAKIQQKANILTLVPASHGGEAIVGRHTSMRFRKREPFFSAALDFICSILCVTIYRTMRTISKRESRTLMTLRPTE